jgi:hypothetical protein
MVLATFNLPEEIRERLKLEENQSELVSKLLLGYFQDLSSEKLKEQIELLETQRKLQEETLNIRIEELQKRLEEKKIIEEKKKKEEESRELVKKLQEESVTEI